MEDGTKGDQPQVEPHLTPAEELRRKRWGAFWWAVSAIVHATAVFCLIYFTPLRKWFFRTTDPSEALESIEGPKIERIVREMIALNTKRIRETVSNQQEAFEELEILRDRAYRIYVKDMTWYANQGQKDMPKVPDSMDVLGSAGPDAGFELKAMDIRKLYHAAQVIEKTSCGTYRHLRAIELSRLQQLPLLRGLEATNVAIPTHPEIKWDLFEQRITNLTDGKMAALKDEMSKLRSEIAAMLATTKRMLDVADALIADNVGATIAQDGNEGAGLGMGESERPKRRDDPFDGYSPPDPSAFEHEWGMGIGPVVHKNELYPRQEGAKLGDKKPTPGRKLMDNAREEAQWMTIDTWYIIGPFPNPNRKNLDHKFPPESGIDSEIDLDATYVGEGGAAIKWQFRKSIDIPVIPHTARNWAIWYAYTEIYSDKEQVKWCIFGSDDYGKAWMNGKLIYASGKTPHPWIPDRAYKKVKFKKGYNPVLFKLENAWGRTGFSMCIFLGGL